MTAGPEKPPRGPWHNRSADLALRLLSSDPNRGLSSAIASERTRRYGANEIAGARQRSVLALLAGQFADFMIFVLIVAAVIAGVLGELRDAIAILVIVALNGMIGAVQEFRAQRAIEALRRIATPTARVIRDGETLSVPSTALVPGDVILLESGDSVPADARLLAESGLRVDESLLTGESLSVDKHVPMLEIAELPLGDQLNMVFKDTLVTRGTATALVVATGESTEIGRIATLLRSETQSKTPLQQRIARFGRQLSLAILALCGLIFLLGLAQGQPPLLMFLTAVSLAVAAVPEALPAVVTVGLALGAYKLSKRHSLVRRLPAVEALGSVTYICADKTGTLTENRMVVDKLHADGQTYDGLPASTEPFWRHIGQALALNNEVKVVDGRPSGDPTELALLRAAESAGFERSRLLESMPRIAEFGFDERRKRMSTLHGDGGTTVIYTKGAPETVLPLCDRCHGRNGPRAIDRAAIERQAETLANDGFRVLAVAMREFGGKPNLDRAETIESQLVFLCLVGLMDPPRPEAPEAVAECRSAGIVPVMITGDHPATALHIAQRLGIAVAGERVMTGAALAGLSDAELRQVVRDIRVYARVDPEQKIRIVEALSQCGEITAMTGDGVNDAPALRSAAIGVAMGKRGTDVAREASDLVLMDDNFATIVSAIREGRRIFDNIRKFIKYTMTSNSGEIWTLLLAPFFGLPVPLLPIHILWINLLTDGLPGLALAAEPEEREVMRRPPRSPQQSFFSGGMWQHMLFIGLLIGGLSIGSQYWYFSAGAEHWQTITFTVLVLAQLYQVFAIRADRESLFKIGLFSNPQLLAAVTAMVLLQLAVIYLPAMNDLFNTRPLPLADLAVCFGLGAVVLVVIEAAKWRQRHSAAVSAASATDNRDGHP